MMRNIDQLWAVQNIIDFGLFLNVQNKKQITQTWHGNVKSCHGIDFGSKHQIWRFTPLAGMPH
jgi:hypothetical protein